MSCLKTGAQTPFSSVSFQRAYHRKGCQFLDQEAELSEEGEGVSSDEEDGEEMNRSLEGFVVNNTHCSQGLNGGTFIMAVSKERKELIFFK